MCEPTQENGQYDRDACLDMFKWSVDMLFREFRNIYILEASTLAGWFALYNNNEASLARSLLVFVSVILVLQTCVLRRHARYVNLYRECIRKTKGVPIVEKSSLQFGRREFHYDQSAIRVCYAGVFVIILVNVCLLFVEPSPTNPTVPADTAPSQPPAHGVAAMTTTQSIFVVFFAVFWGALASVQGRWKMFHWPFISHPHVRHRLVLSMLLANVAPIAFFAVVFFCLRNTLATSPNRWTGWETACQILGGILPAFAVFGFYRLWLGIVDWKRKWFYLSEEEQDAIAELQDKTRKDKTRIEPTVEDLGIYREYAGWNIMFAVAYFIVAVFGVFLARNI